MRSKGGGSLLQAPQQGLSGRQRDRAARAAVQRNAIAAAAARAFQGAAAPVAARLQRPGRAANGEAMGTGSIYLPPMTRERAARPDNARAGWIRTASAGLRRARPADEPPWLHREVARRMAERLAIIRAQPTQLLDWWSWLGAGGRRWRRPTPQAQRVPLVEPTEALKARSEGRWRGPGGRQALAVERARVLLESESLPEGSQLVWSNMMLRGGRPAGAVRALAARSRSTAS